jgi:hypothetical protein
VAQKVTPLNSRNPFNRNHVMENPMIRRFVAALPLLALSGYAFAGTFTPVPEPETLAHLANGAIAIVVARWRRK